MSPDIEVVAAAHPILARGAYILINSTNINCGPYRLFQPYLLI